MRRIAPARIAPASLLVKYDDQFTSRRGDFIHHTTTDQNRFTVGAPSACRSPRPTQARECDSWAAAGPDFFQIVVCEKGNQFTVRRPEGRPAPFGIFELAGLITVEIADLQLGLIAVLDHINNVLAVRRDCGA